MLSLLLTLLATPVAYSLFDDVRAWLARKRASVMSRLVDEAPADNDNGLQAAAQ